MPRNRLASLSLANFKAFDRFELRLPDGDVYLVGPNNAGKSTLLVAARSAAQMVRQAQRLRAEHQRKVNGVLQYGHVFGSEQIGLVEENLRYEFVQEETRLEARFGQDARLVATWPVGEDDGGFFFAKDNDVTLRRPKDVRSSFPSIGVVPILSPVEHLERGLSDSQVKANLDTRLASRHFRNQVYRLGAEFVLFCEYVHEWTPEIQLQGGVQVRPSGTLDMNYTESGGRFPRELFWAGDGIQIWLQLLLHLWRHRNADVVLLDEPEVFLHADLQRRLVSVLDAHRAQTVMATHSSEVIAEAPTDAIVWASRTRRASVRSPKPAVLAALHKTLGSGFNMDLARTLKARAVVFVEGGDMKLLRLLASTLGASNLAVESRMATVSLEGFDRWDRIEQFQWLTKDLLGGNVPVCVILDRDWRLESEVEEVTAALEAVGIDAHVWRRHELESYLINYTAISRISKADPGWVSSELEAISESFRGEAEAQVSVAVRRAVPRLDQVTSVRDAQRLVTEWWSDPVERLHRLPAKELITALNGRLQVAGKKAVSPRSLAKYLRAPEIPTEMVEIIKRLDAIAGDR